MIAGLTKIATNREKQPPVFLATTALEEFWDSSRQIIFLGEWCRRYDRRHYWTSLGGTLIISPWANKKTISQALEYVNDQYESLLSEFAGALNRLHNADHNLRYWRILLGPWLQLYISIMYDRFMCIKSALEDYPDLSTLVLNEDTYKVPVNTAEFCNLALDDTFNLQIYSRVFKKFGKNFPSKSVKFCLTKIQCQRPSLFIRSMIKLKPVLDKFTKYMRKHAAVLCRESYFPIPVELQIVLRTKGRVFPFLAKHEYVANNSSIRSKLRIDNFSRDCFEEFLYAQAVMDIPHCFIEGYEQYNEFAESNHSDSIRALFSSISWYYDEAFKYFAATMSEKGVVLLGAQHGGNYGSIVNHPSEKHERSITDRYYSWGWDHASVDKIVIMPSGKLSNRPVIGADNNKEGIIFVCTSANSRYLLQFPYDSAAVLEYISWQFRFIHACSEEIVKNMRVRFRWDDLGWDIAQRLRDTFPSIREDSFDVPLLKRLQQCRLFVSDNLQTTFLEALSVNKPSILFWDTTANKLRPDAISYYDKLRFAGILHDSPESAAHAIQTVYDDVELWWNEPTRQEARRTFCHRFARTSQQVAKEWSQELENVLTSQSVDLPGRAMKNV